MATGLRVDCGPRLGFVLIRATGCNHGSNKPLAR